MDAFYVEVPSSQKPFSSRGWSVFTQSPSLNSAPPCAPAQDYNCHPKVGKSIFQSKMLGQNISALSPQTALVGCLKSSYSGRQLGFHNRFCGNSICCQSAIYTPSVNKLQFIGKMRPGAKKRLKPITLGAEEVPSVETAFTTTCFQSKS